MKASTILQRLSPLTRFILLGSVLELLYLLIFTLTPLTSTHTPLSPSGTDWPWILAPGQLLVHKTSNLGTRPADLGFYFLLLTLILIALASIYLYAVGNAFHTSNNIPITSRWLFLPMVGATIFGITLLFLPALFTNEANSYIFKSLALLSHLINCVLIWAFLGKFAPVRRLGGTILYAWNPLALIELAGNGHNEGFLICFLLLTTLLIVQQKGWWYDFLAMVFLGFAISINFIALLLFPLYIWSSARREPQQGSKGQQPFGGAWGVPTNLLSSGVGRGNQVLFVWGLCWRAIVALTIVFTLYLPFWHGSATFLAITSSFDMQQFIHSPLGVLVIPVRWLFSFLVQILNVPTTISSYYLQPIIAANMTVLASAMFIFALIYFYLFGKVRSIETLLTSLCLATLGFIVLISVQFWPWYVLWALWIVALRRFDALTVSVLLLSCTALLTYPLLYVDNLPIATYQPLLIFGIPLLYLITQVKRSDERKTLLYDRRSETAKN
ncbi:MAG TPA: hypothetical protein VFZ02_03040 [Ktedonobacteraceae bacterium]